MIWECGIVLAKYIEMAYSPSSLDGRAVLELGAGTGVAGLAVCHNYICHNYIELGQGRAITI